MRPSSVAGLEQLGANCFKARSSLGQHGGATWPAFSCREHVHVHVITCWDALCTATASAAAIVQCRVAPPRSARRARSASLHRHCPSTCPARYAGSDASNIGSLCYSSCIPVGGGPPHAATAAGDVEALSPCNGSTHRACCYPSPRAGAPAASRHSTWPVQQACTCAAAHLDCACTLLALSWPSAVILLAAPLPDCPHCPLSAAWWPRRCCTPPGCRRSMAWDPHPSAPLWQRLCGACTPRHASWQQAQRQQL